MKKTFLFVISFLAFTTVYAEYVVNLTAPASKDGAMAFLYANNDEPIDSMLISDFKATFKGDIDMPCQSMIVIDNARVAAFFLENDTIDVSFTIEDIPGGVRTDWNVRGGELNIANRALYDSIRELGVQYRSEASDSVRSSIGDQYSNIMLKVMEDNADNALGASLAIKVGRPREYFEAHPAIMNLKTVKDYLARIDIANKTRAGNDFSDFSVEYKGTVHRLSDVVGKGDYVLLDFWASWCGPCIRSMIDLKDLYARYGSENFKILGVTVGDKPENSISAINRLELPWEVWISDTGEDASEAYAVESIPHTVLFDPDGKILLNHASISTLKSYLAEIFK